MTQNDDDDRGSALAALELEFAEPALLELALAHSSFSHECGAGRGNERLEFLGDAVLDLVVAQALYEVHPDWDEGDLTRTRAALVNQKSLAERARELELGRIVKLGRTEMRSGGADKDSILANCFEALIGAIYLDAGLARAQAFVRRAYGAALASGGELGARDEKTAFQEWAHAQHRETPSYRTIADSGVEDDATRFRVEVALGGEIWGRGVGRSKRGAERAAAADALQKRASSDSRERAAAAEALQERAERERGAGGDALGLGARVERERGD